MKGQSETLGNVDTYVMHGGTFISRSPWMFSSHKRLTQLKEISIIAILYREPYY